MNTTSEELLTATEAAKLFGMHRTTTRKAAKAGHDGMPNGVCGAYLEAKPRPGQINPAWVATPEAWQTWYETRHPRGRPWPAKETTDGKV